MSPMWSLGSRPPSRRSLSHEMHDWTREVRPCLPRRWHSIKRTSFAAVAPNHTVAVVSMYWKVGQPGDELRQH